MEGNSSNFKGEGNWLCLARLLHAPHCASHSKCYLIWFSVILSEGSNLSHFYEKLGLTKVLCGLSSWVMGLLLPSLLPDLPLWISVSKMRAIIYEMGIFNTPGVSGETGTLPWLHWWALFFSQPPFPGTCLAWTFLAASVPGQGTLPL